MLPLTPGDSPARVPLTPRIALHPATTWHGHVQVELSSASVLSGTAAPTISAPLSLFEPAEPVVSLEIQPIPRTSVLGDTEAQPAFLEYQPTDDAVYVLLQEVHTPDGIIYDWTLPRQVGLQPDGAVLGASATTGQSLFFPITPVALERPPQAGPAVLGLEGIAGDLVGRLIIKRVLQILKTPFEHALLNAIRQAEPEPRILALGDTFQPLDGFEAWRALLPPGGTRRVLLFIHGFGSSTASSSGGAFLSQLASNYDALLSYDHPTISRDPLENAHDLLARIPPDLQLEVDLVVHSRGGLVARSLIELASLGAQFQPRRLITHGTPHAGTPYADPQRWDRLISLGMTAASWLAAAGGVTLWVPRLLEYVLKAAAQGVFALPGIAAMAPGGAFLDQLNAPGNPALLERIRYAAVTSIFSIFNVKELAFRQAFAGLAAQAFLDAPNDMVVPTESMNAIDLPMQTLPTERQLKTQLDHFSYFRNADVITFLRKQLAD